MGYASKKLYKMVVNSASYLLSSWSVYRLETANRIGTNFMQSSIFFPVLQ